MLVIGIDFILWIAGFFPMFIFLLSQALYLLTFELVMCICLFIG